MSDELSELKESAEHGEGGLAPVTVTMAIFAVFVAAVSLLGHRADTEALLNQTKSTDQWAYYQAKDTRLHAYEIFLDQLAVAGSSNAQQVSQLKGKYEKDVERYTEQEKEIEASAQEAEAGVTKNLRRADRFDLGEVLLEAALVICSITLLTKKRVFWGMGMAIGLAGLAFGVAGLLIR
jgi:Domain of unknown function (DUF4337)